MLQKLTESEMIALYLEQAKSMISDPDMWIQREYKKGDRRCAVQALRESIGAHDYENEIIYHRTLEALAGEHDDDCAETAVCNKNDTLTHIGVMGYFDNAISRVRSLALLRETV